MSDSIPFDKFISEISKLGHYQIELGVLSANTGREETATMGITNAEIMFFNETGSPIRHIPPRPVLKITLEYAQKVLLPKTYKKCMDLILDGKASEVEHELELLAMKIEKRARYLIYANDGTFAPNAPSTAAAKAEKIRRKKGTPVTLADGNHPLFDTGQLAKAITCRVIKL